jgi:hyperosmotically inducible protein
LGESPEYKLNRVSVQTIGGIVQLSGFVSTPDQRSKATQIAQRVAGVKRVENSIAIKAD